MPIHERRYERAHELMRERGIKAGTRCKVRYESEIQNTYGEWVTNNFAAQDPSYNVGFVTVIRGLDNPLNLRLRYFITAETDDGRVYRYSVTDLTPINPIPHDRLTRRAKKYLNI